MFLKNIDLTPLGDSALLVRFEQRIDAEVNAQVLALHNAFDSDTVPGITFLVPAYCSLTVGFDPLVIDRHGLCRQIEAIAQAVEPAAAGGTGRTVAIPVCYDEECGPDLPNVAAQTGLSVEEIVALHASPTYRVFMLGFLPGFAYLGTTPEPLNCSRKATARLTVPARSVAIAGRQTAIYPSSAPGGWQVIGRTHLRPFDPCRDEAFLFRAGDAVTFHAISHQEFERQGGAEEV